MVHSGLTFWQNKLCKRRRFLSDPRMSSFLLRILQDPVRPFLVNSGGASLHPLTKWWPALAGHWLPSESGNIRIRLLASAEGPKVTMYRLVGVHVQCASGVHARDGGGWSQNPPL